MTDIIVEIRVLKPYDRVEIRTESDAFLALPRRVYRQSKATEGEALTQEYVDWAENAQMEACWDTALYYITSHTRTKKQIADYLEKKGYHEKAVRSALEKLEGYGFVDDAALARRAARSGNKGALRIRRELQQKGVDEEIIERSMEEIDEESQRESAMQHAKKALSRAKPGEDIRKTKKRMADTLARKGYTWEIIGSVIELLIDLLLED